MEEEEEFSGRSDSGQSEQPNADKLNGQRLELTVTVEDTATGEEFELPPVQVSRAI